MCIAFHSMWDKCTEEISQVDYWDYVYAKNCALCLWYKLIYTRVRNSWPEYTFRKHRHPCTYAINNAGKRSMRCWFRGEQHMSERVNKLQLVWVHRWWVFFAHCGQVHSCKIRCVREVLCVKRCLIVSNFSSGPFVRWTLRMDWHLLPRIVQYRSLQYFSIDAPTVQCPFYHCLPSM